MKRLAQIWDRIWFSRFDPLSAGMFRIALGLLLAFMFFSLRENWERWFAIDGVMSLADADLNAKRTLSWLDVFRWTEGMVPTGTYWAIGLTASIGLTLGCLTRSCCAMLFLLLTSMIHRNPFYANGEDLVARMMLFWGAFAPLGATCSVDAWLRRRWGNANNELPEVWAIRALQINFLLIYGVSLPYKFAQDPAWLAGDALHWTIASDMWWTRGSMAWTTLACGGIVRKLMTYGTIFIEALFPICVWIPSTRWISLAAIVSLHLGIAIMVPGVTLFTLMMVVGAMLFVPAEWWRRVRKFKSLSSSPRMGYANR
jgi:hypothetical protein